MAGLYSFASFTRFTVFLFFKSTQMEIVFLLTSCCEVLMSFHYDSTNSGLGDYGNHMKLSILHLILKLI